MIDGWVIHRFHRFPQIGLGGRRTEDGRQRAEGAPGARDFHPQISQISTDGVGGVPRNLKVAGTGILLTIICVNLCESVDNPSPLSRIRVIRVIRGHTLCSSGLFLNHWGQFLL